MSDITEPLSPISATNPGANFDPAIKVEPFEVAGPIAEGAYRISKKPTRLPSRYKDECLEEADASRRMIQQLHAKIQWLETSRRQFRRQLGLRTEALRDARGDAKSAANELLELQKEVDHQKEELNKLRDEVNRYRSWWLSEHHFVKVLLGLVPQAKRADVRLIGAASQARLLLLYPACGTFVPIHPKMELTLRGRSGLGRVAAERMRRVSDAFVVLAVLSDASTESRRIPARLRARRGTRTPKVRLFMHHTSAGVCALQVNNPSLARHGPPRRAEIELDSRIFGIIRSNKRSCKQSRPCAGTTPPTSAASPALGLPADASVHLAAPASVAPPTVAAPADRRPDGGWCFLVRGSIRPVAERAQLIIRQGCNVSGRLGGGTVGNNWAGRGRRMVIWAFCSDRTLDKHENTEVKGTYLDLCTVHTHYLLPQHQPFPLPLPVPKVWEDKTTERTDGDDQNGGNNTKMDPGFRKVEICGWEMMPSPADQWLWTIPKVDQ
ncbi:hypothetical protein DFP72DRAFT_862822 [Ephemerocybe angulata]|uniref:Uncharacterized protein n=1 Tax=Ephemerocybe angulata TaxID=980116 RepID=A0A8H6H772_9AGAR|nr:hypothetical protein DFP72DRAFT_862822 [Tulosesus angulatus]